MGMGRIWDGGGKNLGWGWDEFGVGVQCCWQRPIPANICQPHPRPRGFTAPRGALREAPGLFYALFSIAQKRQRKNVSEHPITQLLHNKFSSLKPKLKNHLNPLNTRMAALLLQKSCPCLLLCETLWITLLLLRGDRDGRAAGAAPTTSRAGWPWFGGERFQPSCEGCRQPRAPCWGDLISHIY